MSVQKIVTSSGETLVVLPMAEYESLVDAADIAAADAVRRDIANGMDEVVPSEIVNRIVDGENPVRVWRDHRNLSARTVAEKAGISPAYLSEIETGKKEGTVSTLKKIAEALGVDLDDLA